MPALQIIALDTATPQLRAPATGDTYLAPRAIAITPEALTGSAAGSSLDIAQTWNTTGTPTALKLNVTDTASNAASLLLDLRIGGTSQFNVRKDGTVTAAAAAFFGGTVRTAVLSITPNDDTFLHRDAAATLAQRNGTNAQTFRIYNTFTDASNGEWFETTWSAQANTIVLRANNNGTGTLRNLHLRAYAMQIWGATTYFTTNTGVVSVAVAPQSAGVAALVDPTGSDFNRLQFGGTTSSYPALKRNSTALETKLADDSAYAPHAMQYLDVTDGITAPTSATGRARIYVDTADGDLKVIFADGTVKTIVTDS